MSEAPTRRVCVIGAGIAGLVTSKVMDQDGFEVHVFERDTHLGGTWAPSRTYPGLRTNNSKRTYEFSDFPYPDDTADFPFAEDVRKYLEAYADRFNVRPLIRFQSEVTDVSRSTIDPDKLTVTVKSSEGEQSESVHGFDFVVVCNGVLHEPIFRKSKA